MRVIKTTSDVLTKLFGVTSNDLWHIAHNGNWIEIRPHRKTGLFQVNCLLSKFTKTISNEVAFQKSYENYFEEI